MNANKIDYSEIIHEARRGLMHKREQLIEEVDNMGSMLQALDEMDGLISENGRLCDEIEQLRQQLAEEKRQRAELEMQLGEMSKLSAGVAKKASQDELTTALRTYINISKRKTLSKRSAVKMMIMELTSAVGLTLPDDVKAALDCLDDEQAEGSAVTVNVAAGGINVQQANTVGR